MDKDIVKFVKTVIQSGQNLAEFFVLAAWSRPWKFEVKLFIRREVIDVTEVKSCWAKGEKTIWGGDFGSHILSMSFDHLLTLWTWLLNSSKFHQKVRRKRSEKKVRVLFLKSTSSTIKQPTSKLKIIVVKYVKKYVAGLLAQLAKAPVLWSIRLQVRNPSLRFSCSAKDYVGAPAGLSNLFCGLSSIQ